MRLVWGVRVNAVFGDTSDVQILAEFPQLTSEDVRACLAYAAERERRTVSTPAA